MTEPVTDNELRWNYPTRVRPTGRGGATHILNPDTQQPYCGQPAGRRLTETELASRAPECRTCTEAHNSLVHREQTDAFLAHRRVVEAGIPEPLHIQQWRASRAGQAE
jgi:hypothetical protein